MRLLFGFFLWFVEHTQSGDDKCGPKLKDKWVENYFIIVMVVIK